jgi:hypothetical protein
MGMENDGGMMFTGVKPKNSEKNCPSATLSATNPTEIDSGANPGLHSERPATNRLSHGTASRVISDGQDASCRLWKPNHCCVHNSPRL